MTSGRGTPKGLVDRLDDDLVGIDHPSHQCRAGNQRRRALTLHRELTHPLVVDQAQLHVREAVFVQEMPSQLAQHARSGHVLDEGAGLAEAHGETLDALLGRQQGFDDLNRHGHHGRHERCAQRAEAFTVNGPLSRRVERTDPVHVLPIQQARSSGKPSE